jgi:hypothetical protein
LRPDFSIWQFVKLVMPHFKERLSISLCLRIKFSPVPEIAAQKWVWRDESSLTHVGRGLFSALSLSEASHQERRGLLSAEGQVGMPALLGHPTKSEGSQVGVLFSIRGSPPTKWYSQHWRLSGLPTLKSGCIVLTREWERQGTKETHHWCWSSFHCPGQRISIFPKSQCGTTEVVLVKKRKGVLWIPAWGMGAPLINPCEGQQFTSWILEHCRLEKEFTERESGRRQRFIRAPLREETNSRWLCKRA